MYGKNTRLTAKPVQLPTTTGVFLIFDPNSSVSSTTCRAVAWHRQAPEAANKSLHIN